MHFRSTDFPIPLPADDDRGDGLLDVEGEALQDGPSGKGKGDVADADQTALQPVS